MTNEHIDIFIPSYHRPKCNTARFFIEKAQWTPEKVHIFMDSEADDKKEYEELCKVLGCKLHIFDMDEARRRYDYVHRASISRRSAGQARNMMQDFAKANNIDYYVVLDDDTEEFCVRNKYCSRSARPEEIKNVFNAIIAFMVKRGIGLFGLSQTGDLFGGIKDDKIFRKKVMNTTFYLLPFIYRGERGVQDDDTSQFAGIYNEGLFTGSLRYGLILKQKQSATQKGCLTDLYNECKLLNKSLVVPIQFPSCCFAEKQKKNGGRLHHRIIYKYLMPCILKNKGGRDNIAWDTYAEDVPFTNEPKRKKL